MDTITIAEPTIGTLRIGDEPGQVHTEVPHRRTLLLVLLLLLEG